MHRIIDRNIERVMILLDMVLHAYNLKERGLTNNNKELRKKIKIAYRGGFYGYRKHRHARTHIMQ